MDIEPYKRSWTYRHTGTHTIFSMHGGLLAKIKSAGLLDCWIFLGMKDNAFAVKTNSWLCFKNTSNKRNYPVKSGLFHVSHLRIPERVSFQKMWVLGGVFFQVARVLGSPESSKSQGFSTTKATKLGPRPTFPTFCPTTTFNFTNEKTTKKKVAGKINEKSYQPFVKHSPPFSLVWYFARWICLPLLQPNT